jgi:hypothetical protein
VGRTILRRLRRTLWITLLVAGWLSLALGAYAGFLILEMPRTSATSGCEQSEHPCLLEQHAIVVTSDLQGLEVRYAETGRTEFVDVLWFRGPPVGADVRIQRRDGELVAVYDPKTDRRYRTLYWPRRWDWYALALGLFGSLVVAVHLKRLDAPRWVRTTIWPVLSGRDTSATEETR